MDQEVKHIYPVITDLNPMSEEELICVCMSVSRGEIRDAVRNGQHTMDDLKAALLCCTGCGTCEPKVKALLEEVLKQCAGDQPNRS